MSGGSFSINGFTGPVTVGGTAYSAAPGSSMSGSGAIANVGDTVSGNYTVNSTAVLDKPSLDAGAFSGARIQLAGAPSI